LPESRLDAQLTDFAYPWYSRRVEAPKQQNGYDCGIFLLEFIARFLHNPKSLICNPKSSILNLKERQDFEFIDVLHSKDGQLLERESDFLLENYFTGTNQQTLLKRNSDKPPWFDGSVTSLRREQIKKFLIDLAFMDRDGKELSLKTVNAAFNKHYTMRDGRLAGGEPSS